MSFSSRLPFEKLPSFSDLHPHSFEKSQHSLEDRLSSSLLLSSSSSSSSALLSSSLSSSSSSCSSSSASINEDQEKQNDEKAMLVSPSSCKRWLGFQSSDRSVALCKQWSSLPKTILDNIRLSLAHFESDQISDYKIIDEQEIKRSSDRFHVTFEGANKGREINRVYVSFSASDGSPVLWTPVRYTCTAFDLVKEWLSAQANTSLYSIESKDRDEEKDDAYLEISLPAFVLRQWHLRPRSHSHSTSTLTYMPITKIHIHLLKGFYLFTSSRTAMGSEDQHGPFLGTDQLHVAMDYR